MKEKIKIKFLVKMEPPKGSRLSQEFHHLFNLCKNKHLDLGTLVHSLLTRSYSVLTLLFSFPFLLPIPLPGLSFVLGALIMLVAFGEIINKRPKLPDYFLKKKIPYGFFSKVFYYSEKLSKYLEKITKPRGAFLIKHPWIRRLNGLLIFISALLLALPLPPGTNFTPALAIFLLSLAGLEEDILIMFISYIVFLFNVIFFSLIFFFGINGIKMIHDVFF